MRTLRIRAAFANTTLALAALVAAGLTTSSAAAAGVPPAGAADGLHRSDSSPGSDDVTYREPYRPQFHFTPGRNWMNDPNGLVFHKGIYHLFFQHNPAGITWGNMSWGHATSTDLVHWGEQPLAIPDDEENYIFSGSVVVDRDNSSGFGTRRNPPLVAIYTAAAKECCRQAQALAYSTDDDRTWTKYAGNPVLDIGSGEFRDPKVFWYAPGRKWVMSVVLATERKVSFYASSDLKAWTHLSDFGPANAVGGVWECPDLFPLAVDGNPRTIKWVLVVSLNPGGVAGGSGSQYFVGDFDGTTFTADNVLGSYTPPSGTLVEGFEGSDFGAWTSTGTAFGPGPASGNLPGQGGVEGFVGNGLANSFFGGDSATGTLTSPPFALTAPYLNLLVGGGNHPHVEGTVEGPPPQGTVFADFEGTTYGPGWVVTGTFAGTTPPAGTIGDQQPVSGYEGSQLVNTFIDHDLGTGTFTSPDFTISQPYVNLLVGGGNHPWPGSAENPATAVNLVVDGEVVATATGQDSEALNWVGWDVTAFAGRTAHIEIVDANTGGWGHVLVDHITFADERAQPRSVETAVNLLVDEQVVRSATGRNSERLDWVGWNVADLAGQTARLQIVDRNTGGWGHILVDQIVLADEAALSVEQRSDWLDYGKDYYAAVSWNNLPLNRRILIGWMSNWNYAGAIPTSPWRSAMSVPREVNLRTIAGRPQLVSDPVEALDTLHSGRPYARDDVTVSDRTLPLSDRRARGKALDIRVTLEPGSADVAGVRVRVGNGQHTVIGYDARTQEVFVDRTRSGDASFSTDFASSVQRAPLRAWHGKVHLRVLVDWSSVEVFAQGGMHVITDQIYPDASSDGVELFATGGRARFEDLTIHRMASIWQHRDGSS